MAKNKNKRPANIAEATKVVARMRAEELRAEQVAGVKRRAVSFPNRKAVAARKACRGKVSY